MCGFVAEDNLQRSEEQRTFVSQVRSSVGGKVRHSQQGKNQGEHNLYQGREPDTRQGQGRQPGHPSRSLAGPENCGRKRQRNFKLELVPKGAKVQQTLKGLTVPNLDPGVPSATGFCSSPLLHHTESLQLALFLSKPHPTDTSVALQSSMPCGDAGLMKAEGSTG